MKSKPEEKAQKTTNHSTPKPWDEMNRKQRRATMRKIQSADLSLEVVHPNAGGIDIGNESHYVAVPPDPFRPTQEIRTMRTYWRQRNDLVQAARHIQRMQKVLTQMNVQLANVLSDISGVTGQAIHQSHSGG
jgi:hypothetical protein